MIGRSILALEKASLRRGCGAKASGLARLIALGHCVPRGIVVTDREFRRHLEVSRALESSDPAEIRRRIVTTPLSNVLRARLVEALAALHWPVAVRSSAAGEDSASASFAGQLDSLLDVESAAGVENAIRVVWASPWNERCASYASRRGIRCGALGVIVQEQVDARFSGVLFTRDPLDATAEPPAVIEFVAGLGDRLVAGKVNPSRVRIERGEHAAHESGLALCDIAQAGWRLEDALGAAQDIEWSVDGAGRLFLLQARPITARARPLVSWSNANIAENFPGRVCPFLYSIVSRGYTAYFRNLALGFGISPRRVEAMAPRLEGIVGIHGGYLYYNLSNIHAVLRLAPFGTALAAAFNRFTGARGLPTVPQVRMGRAERVVEAVRIAAMTSWKYLFIQRRVAAFERRADAFAARTHPDLLPGRSREELRRDLDAFMEIRLARWNDAAIADAAAMVCYAALERVVGEHVAAQNDLLKGLPGLASARPVAELWKLSRWVLLDAELASILAATPAEDIVARLHEPRLAAFRERFQRYLDEWGFRYSGELMLTQPTPREEPAPMIRILQSYLRDTGPGPIAIGEQQARARVAATRELLSRLPWPRALLLRIVVAATQGSIRLRERARMKQALLYTRLRHIALGLGEIGVEAPCLTPGSTPPPDAFELPEGAVWQPREEAPRRASAATSLRGTGACGGEAEGEAHVIEDVARIGEFRAGEILVTRQTDPGWAAVFFLTKGLVIERGGMLSHGAIIAREYGIPAVVGVDDATTRIRSGERIRVDGNHGIVELAHG